MTGGLHSKAAQQLSLPACVRQETAQQDCELMGLASQLLGNQLTRDLDEAMPPDLRACSVVRVRSDPVERYREGDRRKEESDECGFSGSHRSKHDSI